METVFADAAPEEGIHDLRPAGPWPMPGTVPPINGRIPGTWTCTRCSRTAGDTSRAKELARKPCSGAEWTAAAATHVLVPMAEGWKCSRCLLTVRPQHAAQTGRQQCPVPVLSRAGVAWPAGEAGLRATFGRIRAFRHFCCPAETAEEEEPVQQAPLQQSVQQLWLRQGAGLQLAEAALAPGAAALAAAKLPESAAAAGAAATSSASAASSRAAEAGPLLAAAGAEARRALKMVRQPLQPAEFGAATGGAAAGEAAAAALALQPTEFAEMHCEPSETPCRKRTYVAPEASVSPFFSLQPYASHKPAFVGRSLWCLDCFEVPGSAHRSWRHGRCGGPKPPTTMPPALRDGIFRQSAACPKLQASIRARWAVLAGALGLH